MIIHHNVRKGCKDRFVCKFDILKIILILSLVQRPNDINYEYRTDIVHNIKIEDTYSVVWKLETQLIIKPKIIIQEESGEKINEQRREYLVQG